MMGKFKALQVKNIRYNTCTVMLTQQKMTEEYYTKKYHTTICLYHLYKDVMSLWTACISITNISMHSHSQ